jgi:OPA family glycerol-3-phosphate transporter-like MFS transporter
MNKSNGADVLAAGVTWEQQTDVFQHWQKRVFLVLWITYASFYLGRINFSVALPGIMAEFGWNRAQVGAIGTALFWAYAIGQFINGQLGDRLGARLLITIGLTVSAFMNLLFGFSQALGIMIIIWAINGYVQSMGWAPSIKTLANWFPPRVRGKMSGRLGTSYILGGAVSVVLAGFIAVRLGWRATFYIPSVFLLLSAIHWYGRAKNSPESVDLPALEAFEGEEAPQEKKLPSRQDEYLGLRYTLNSSIGSTQVWLMALGLFFVNILRYGFLTWAPTYLFETQHAAIDKAAYSSAIFPIAGALGAIFAGWATDRWFQSRRAPVACISLVVAGLLAWVYRFVVPVDQWGLGLIMLAAIGFAVFGAHVLIVAAAPMDFGTRKAAASATGFIDCWGYVGAGLEGFGTGLLVDLWGWNAGFGFWIASSFCGAALMALLWRYKPAQGKYL